MWLLVLKLTVHWNFRSVQNFRTLSSFISSHWMVMMCAFLSHFQVCVENLCTKQAEKEVEVRGPPVSKAFDNQGNATKVWHSFSPESLSKFAFLAKWFVWWDYLKTAIEVVSNYHKCIFFIINVNLFVFPSWKGLLVITCILCFPACVVTLAKLESIAHLLV